MSKPDPNSLAPAQLQTDPDGPALVSPDGTYNFINPPNGTVLFHGVIFTCLAIACVLFLVRAYARVFCVKVVRTEDYLGFTSLATLIAYVYCCYRLTDSPGGLVHQWNYQLKNMPTFNYFLFVGTVLLFASLMFMKAAILLEWIHIFASHSRNSFFWISHTLLWVLVLLNLSIIIAVLAKCQPFEKNFDPSIPGTCIDLAPVDYSSTIFSLVADLIIFILPQKVIWSLRLSTNKKLGLSALFAAGIFGCMCACFRLYWTVLYYDSLDSTYYSGPCLLWGVAELAVGSIVFCMPATPKALATIPPFMFSVKSWASSSSRKLKGLRSSEPNSTSRSHRPISKNYREIEENHIELLDSRGPSQPESSGPLVGEPKLSHTSSNTP
ncbi:hypothetical protein GGR52DRAFT_104922 [Hypoxylon sp. FL1284]|nr:hypothetical protein GGR52DRAFT_104922 [Hypoxylon sp. FL1284]